MSLSFSGPMFERADSGPWRSVHHKEGAHYNTYECRGENAMAALREFFPNGEAGELNLVLFSTSGVHGTYGTIEEAEADIGRGNKDEDGDECTPEVTFLVVQPRICCLRYGNCRPVNAEDIAFLKKLRETSWLAVQAIGRHEEEP
jgi:hypothetical protein